MKEVKVLGPGCARCKTLVETVRQVAEQSRIEIHLEKIEDMAAIVAAGVMSTPGLVIEGKLVHSGSVPDSQKIATWLKGIGD